MLPLLPRWECHYTHFAVVPSEERVEYFAVPNPGPHFRHAGTSSSSAHALPAVLLSSLAALF